MIVELLRALSDRLADPTAGLAAYYASLPSEPGDDWGVLDWRILHEARDLEAALMRYPESGAVALVISDGARPLIGEQPGPLLEADCDMRVTLGLRDPDSVRAIARTYRGMAAVVASLHSWLGQGGVQRGGVQIYHISRSDQVLVLDHLEDTLVLGSVSMTFRIRYMWEA